MTAPRNNRAGSFGVRQLLSQTSDRDRQIVASVYEFSCLTTEHLCELHFPAHASHAAAHRACTRVLTRLMQLRLIHRLPQRRGGLGGGSSQYVWMIDSAGDRLTRHLQEEDARPRRKPFQPSGMFLEHTLAVGDVYLELVRAYRNGQLEKLQVEAEPRNWRSFPEQLGSVRVLKPDLHVMVVPTGSEYEEHWFIEVDRGTEWTKVLMRKVRLYEDYRRSGVEKKRSGVSPRVLWLMPDLRRVDLLQAAIARDPKVNAKAFVVTETPHLLQAVRGDDQPPPIQTELSPTKGGRL